MALLLSPIDVLHFGTGKGSVAVDTHIIKTNRFPYPFTIAGALRSYIMSKKGLSPSLLAEYLRGEVTQNEEYDKLLYGLNIIGPFLFKEGVIYFNIPFDILCSPEERSLNKAFLEGKVLNPLQYPDLIMDMELSYIPWLFSRERMKYKKGIISLEEFKEYLLGKEKVTFENENIIFVDNQRRPGIKIDRDTRTAEEHYLYFEEFVTFNNNDNKQVGYYIETSLETEMDSEFIAPLGGENKWIYGEKLDRSLKEEFNSLKEKIKQEVVKDNGYFKLIFLTPAYFKNGWKPQMDNIEIMGAVLNRPENIGGWDMATMTSTPIRRYVPAGSVYYCKTEDIENLFENYFLNTISDEFGGYGFGLCVIGKLNKEEK